MKKKMITIDGSYGEGGGQLLRTSLTLATILQQPVHIINIRANRKNPGLAAQHLTAVHAAAMICDAAVTGAELESTVVTFEPRQAPQPGIYEFDVAQARQGGSAGAASLVLQTVLLPLSQAPKASTVTVKGGTHVAWSPSFHYLRDIFLPMVAPLGIQATVELSTWGWYPIGEGEIVAEIPGQASPATASGGSASRQASSNWVDRGALERIEGLAVASSLPSHIAQRMTDRATNLLQAAGLPVAIEPRRVRSASPGAGIFLTAEYEFSRAGFSALGKKGKPSEKVAEEAVEALRAFQRGGAFLDEHLTDQLVLPLALSGWQGTILTQSVTNHTLTNLWVVEQFLGAVAQTDPSKNLVHFFRG